MCMVTTMAVISTPIPSDCPMGGFSIDERVDDTYSYRFHKSRKVYAPRDQRDHNSKLSERYRPLVLLQGVCNKAY